MTISFFVNEKVSYNLGEKKEGKIPALDKTESSLIWYHNIEIVTTVVTQYLSFQLQ